MNQLLNGDDTVLLGDSKENIQRLLNVFENFGSGSGSGFGFGI